MFVKLCGTTSLEDAQLGLAHGADALGFIFAPSKRRVTAEQAAAIIARLPDSVETVGVFTGPDAASILATARLAGLTAVQLHLPYDAALLAELKQHGLRLWQVLPFEIDPIDVEISEAAFLDGLQTALGDERLTAILIDTARGGVSGGTGQSFNWERARALLDRALARFGQQPKPRIILAGGLNPENVAQAIRTMQPWGVDVVSGVESSPGRKDPARIQAFLQAVTRQDL